MLLPNNDVNKPSSCGAAISWRTQVMNAGNKTMKFQISPEEFSKYTAHKLVNPHRASQYGKFRLRRQAATLFI